MIVEPPLLDSPTISFQSVDKNRNDILQKWNQERMWIRPIVNRNNTEGNNHESLKVLKWKENIKQGGKERKKSILLPQKDN